MPKLPGIPHLAAVRALQKVGFRIVRQGKHVVMSNGIVRDAGLSQEQFRKLL